jgi:hypothetical protein
MKNLFVIAGLFLLSLSAISQQISLYDSDGEARAYTDRDEVCFFGFNGSFLGWYENGIIYDKHGYTVGIRKGAVNMVYKPEHIKGIQRIVPIRPITPIIPIQPILKNYWSSESLTEFLYFGKK